MLTPRKQQAADELALLAAELTKRSNYKINSYFQDEGPLRRDLYTRALQFFDAGLRFPERLLLGGNRTGKTDAAAYEITLHLTGLYPKWWQGRRFDHPVEVWCAGDTATTTRDIQQLILYGQIPTAPRTGMIPAHLILHHSSKTSIPNAVETVIVQHVSGGKSMLQFKSYDQRRLAFQGTSKHIIWLDEECPEDVYTESLLRTLTCAGIMITTFTPVEGLTPFVQKFLESGIMLMPGDNGEDRLVPAEEGIFQGEEVEVADVQERILDPKATKLEDRQKVVIAIAWDEVPHLSKAAQAQMLADIPEYQRAARMRGVPHLGSGVIYPVPEEEIRCTPFKIPEHWPRGYGMDVGWNWTVAIWGAYDAATQTWYLFHEHYRSHAEPPVHAAAISSVGWPGMPGRIDPASMGSSQIDGRQLLQLYLNHGLNLDIAPNSVEAGIGLVWSQLTQGKIRVFSTLRHFFTEYRMYRRDAKGRPVKKNDHLMDAARYLVGSGTEWLATGPSKTPKSDSAQDAHNEHLWLS